MNDNQQNDLKNTKHRTRHQIPNRANTNDKHGLPTHVITH